MTTDVCASVSIKYSGNGVRKNFPFTFTYLHFYDVKAALWDENQREYKNNRWEFKVNHGEFSENHKEFKEI